MRTQIISPAASIASRLASTVESLAVIGFAALLLGAAATPASAQSRFGVINGGFETGDLTGWTVGGNGGIFIITSPVHSGKFATEFGAVGAPGTLSQNIRTFAGGTYTLTYFLRNDGGTPNSWSTTFNGATLSSIVNGPAQPYTQYTFSGLQVNGTSTPLIFSGRQDPQWWQLDDVSLALNNLVNSSTVYLGPGPAVLPITHNFTQTSKGVLQIQVGGVAPSQHDLIAVGNDAKLGGTLQLLRLNNFTFHRGDKVTILTAGGKVSGDFASYVGDFGDSILSPVAVIEKHSVVLEVQSFEQFAVNSNLTPNEIATARGLDSTRYNSRLNRALDFLDSRSLSDLPGDLDRLAPEELSSIYAIGYALANVQSLNIQRRTDDVRSGSSGFNAANLAINGRGPSYSGPAQSRSGVAGPSGNDGKEGKEVQTVAPAENRWGVFLSGTGEWVSVGDTDNARGYNLESGGFTLGIDYKVTPNFAIGLAAGYTGTTADLVDRGRIWVNGGKIGLYGTFFQNEQVASAPTMSKDSSKDSSKEAPAPAVSIAKGFYADAAVFGGYNSYDTRRAALQGEARGDTDGGEVDALFGIGYDFKMGGLTFGPTATFNYTYLGTNGFNERGSLAPLDVHGGKGESLRSAFGLKASYDWKIGGVLIKPEIRAAWQHEYGDATYEIQSNFAGGDTFSVDGPQIGRDSVLLGAGFAVQLNDRCAIYTYYDGELGRKNYQSTAVTGGVRVAF